MVYSKKVLAHFRHPKNQGVIKNADAESQVGNPVCGDVMKIYLKVVPTKAGKGGRPEKFDPKRFRIKDIKFETLGCAAAIAVSSALTETVKGKSIEAALKVNRDDIVKALGGLPDQKIHCSMLGIEALHKAVNEYQKNFLK